MRRFACSLGQIRILKSKLSYFATITLGFSLNMIGVGKSKLFSRLDFFFTTRRFRQSIFPVDSSVSHIVSPASRKTVDGGGGKDWKVDPASRGTCRGSGYGSSPQRIYRVHRYRVQHVSVRSYKKKS